MSDEFTLEKLKIHERLSSLETEVKGYCESTNRLLEKHDLIIMGDGNGRKGLNVRVDRIEQKELDRHKITWTLISANLAIVVKMVWDWLSHQK